MGNKYIQQLIGQGEHDRLDFKYEVTDAKKLARTFSAFANTGGGKLLIGVKDNGVISGIRTDEEAYMLESAAHVFCKPAVGYSIKSWSIEGKQILEVSIEESDSKPHLAPWKEDLWRAFIRLRDENFVANSIQLQVWKNLNSAKSTIVKYSRQEKELLTYLTKNKSITLGAFRRLSKISYSRAKKILVNLCTIGVIKIHYTDKNSAEYQLSDN